MNRLGTTSAGEALEVDLERLVGSHACVVANAGAGKSGLIRVLLEQTHGRVQHIVLDAEDEFYTLRERFEYLIAGGAGGDVPAAVENAEALATTLLTHGISAIVQLNSLKAVDQERFVARFLNAVMEAPAELWHPVLIVLDEAHRFAPQDGYAESHDAVRELSARGRKRGFTLVAATQRLAKIDKNVTGDVNNWLLGRVGQATDRKVAADMLGFPPSSAEGRGLQTLEPRSFWAFGVALASPPELFRVGQAETTIIKAGQAKVPTPPPPERMAGLLDALRDAAKPVATPPLPGAGTTPDAPHIDIAAIEKVAFDKGRTAGRAEGRSEGFQLALTRARAALTEMRDEGESAAPSIVAPAPMQPADPAAARATPRRAAPTPPNAPVSQDSKRTGKLAALDAISWWRAAGFDEIDRPRAALVAGLSPKASTFGVYVGQLVKEGLVEVPKPGLVALTAAGAAEARMPAKPNAGDVRAFAKALVSAAEARLFDAIIAAYPNDVSRADLADQVGLSRTASTLGVYVGRLSSFGFVEAPKPGRVRAADWLFPKASRR